MEGRQFDFGHPTPANGVPVTCDDAAIGLRRTKATLFSIFAVGALITLLNLRWPVARNALIYAKTSRDILDHHFDLAAVVRDQAWTGGKPILFPLLASPFTWMLNANAGVVIASFIGTAFFLWISTLVLTRLNRRYGVDPTFMSLELILITINPLVMCQFWSAYPDSLFAGFVLLAFYLTDTISTEPKLDTRRQIAALGVTVLAAIHTKLYGAILSFICPVYILLNAKLFLRQTFHLWSKIAGLCVALGAPIVLLVLAKNSLYPLICVNMNANTGINDYVVGVGGMDFKAIEAALAMMGIAILLAFHFSILFAGVASARRVSYTVPVVFFLLYMGGLLPASGTAYNMRYFLPFFVLPALSITAGIQTISRVPRRVILSCYGVVAILLTANFNVAWVEETLYPLAPRLFGHQLDAGAWFDNLRLRTQIGLRKQIDVINEKVPSGGRLYWSSDYYGMVTHGLAHDLGVRSDLDIRYVLEPTDPPIWPATTFLAEFTSLEPAAELWRSPHWATVINLGHGVFRLDPIAVKLTSLSGESVPRGGTVRMREDVVAGAQIQVSATEMLLDRRIVSTTANRHIEMVFPNLSTGRHEFVSKTKYGTVEVASSQPLVVYVGVAALERTATSSGDLAREDRDGSIDVPQNMLGLDRDERWIGLRFDDVVAPRGARVRQAHLRFTVTRPESEKTVISIWGQLSANAASLSLQSGNLSARPRTFAYVGWEPGPWKKMDSTATSADLTAVVEEILAQHDWESGNSILLLLSVSGHSRLVSASSANDEAPPTLYVEQESKE